MSHHQNKVRVKAVARALKELNEDVVYIGGASISLYADEEMMPDHRPTDDIDIIIEMTSYGHYAKIRERLIQLGFSEDIKSKVICRWKISGIIVDIMPLNDQLWGFSNPWYEKSFPERKKISLDDVDVYILPVHLLVLTKWEALQTRKGGVDWRWSHDFEDIVKVLMANHTWYVLDSNATTMAHDFKHVLNELVKDESFFYEACRGQLNTNYYSDETIIQLIYRIKNHASV